MPYNGKTDWKLNDTVYPEDMNRIEGQIGKNTSEIEGVSGKIGTEADADTQPTLFGRLAQLKNVLLEKLAEVLTKVTGMDGKIGTNEDSAGASTLFGQVKDISEKMPTGIVKSVQRGYEQIPYNSDTSNPNIYEIDVEISEVNPQKCFVILDSGTIRNSNANGDNVFLIGLTNTNFRVKANNGAAGSKTPWFSWQVIELN